MIYQEFITGQPGFPKWIAEATPFYSRAAPELNSRFSETDKKNHCYLNNSSA
jgi:hypothetical protein